MEKSIKEDFFINTLHQLKTNLFYNEKNNLLSALIRILLTVPIHHLPVSTDTVHLF